MIPTYRLSAGVAVLVTSLGVAACGSRGDDEPPVATLTVELDRSRVALGGPVDLTFQFDVSSDAPAIGQSYRVFVHVLDRDGDLMWSDDHDLPVPVSEWIPGRTIRYTHTMFVPVYPYLGPATINAGLYLPADGHRLPLSGDHQGQRAYRVASIDLLPQSDGVMLLYRDGWHPVEVLPQNPAVQWQWTHREATVAFRNPGRDATIWIHADGPAGLFEQPQRVTVAVAGEPIETFALEDGAEVVQRIACSRDCFGSEEMVELQLRIEPTFVPAEAAGTPDFRELGVRVFHLFVDPHGDR